MSKFKDVLIITYEIGCDKDETLFRIDEKETDKPVAHLVCDENLLIEKIEFKSEVSDSSKKLIENEFKQGKKFLPKDFL